MPFVGEVKSEVSERREAVVDDVESGPCFPVFGEEALPEQPVEMVIGSRCPTDQGQAVTQPKSSLLFPADQTMTPGVVMHLLRFEPGHLQLVRELDTHPKQP